MQIDTARNIRLLAVSICSAWDANHRITRTALGLTPQVSPWPAGSGRVEYLREGGDRGFSQGLVRPIIRSCGWMGTYDSVVLSDLRFGRASKESWVLARMHIRIAWSDRRARHAGNPA